MNIYDQAAEAIEREVIRLDGLKAAGQVLKELGSLENARLEAEQGTVRARSDRDAAVKELDEAKQRLATAEANAADVQTRADQRARAIVEDAQDRAATITTEADTQAKQIRQSEVDTRERALKALNDRIAAGTKTLENLTASIAAAKDDEAAAVQLREEAEQGLAKVQAEIKKLQLQ
jgi:hypothetical protein